jgi:hypothetical protein
VVGMIDRPLQRDGRSCRAVDTDDHCSIFIRWIRHDSTLTEPHVADQGPTSLTASGVVRLLALGPGGATLDP